MPTRSVLLAFASLSLHVPAATGQAATAIAIANVTIVRVEDGSRLPDQTVQILGDRIIAVGASKSATVPASARWIVSTEQPKRLARSSWAGHAVGSSVRA